VELKTLQIALGVPFTVVPFVLVTLMILASVGMHNSCTSTFTAWFMVPIFALLVFIMMFITAGRFNPLGLNFCQIKGLTYDLFRQACLSEELSTLTFAQVAMT
jgi:hypothetical protein